jgi:hypothetical protein
LAYRAVRDRDCPTATVHHRLTFADGLSWESQRRGLRLCTTGELRLGPLHTPVY